MLAKLQKKQQQKQRPSSTPEVQIPTKKYSIFPLRRRRTPGLPDRADPGVVLIPSKKNHLSSIEQRTSSECIPSAVPVSTRSSDGGTTIILQDPRRRQEDEFARNGANVRVTRSPGPGFSALVTGEVLHQLADAEDFFPDGINEPDKVVSFPDHPFAKFTSEMWGQLLSHLNPPDSINFTFACRKIRNLPVDGHLPNQLFCFACGEYHKRLAPGQERVRPFYASHPVFDCPKVYSIVPPKTRLAAQRELPYYLVQLAMRGHRYGLKYGVPMTALSRSWTDSNSDWRHRIKFHPYKGHLLMRVSSSCFADAELTANQERLLIFERNEYAPYFSVCDHWAHGELISLVKCALKHIPKKRIGLVQQLSKAPKLDFERLRTPNFMPKQCDECRPMRRCPDCPTEYLIDIKMAEDKKSAVVDRFRHAICITRWSDLGDGTSPSSPEWAACNGQREFSSFSAVRNASLCSLFEAATSNHAPNHKLISLKKHRTTTDTVD